VKCDIHNAVFIIFIGQAVVSQKEGGGKSGTILHRGLTESVKHAEDNKAYKKHIFGRQ